VEVKEQEAEEDPTNYYSDVGFFYSIPLLSKYNNIFFV